MAGNAPAAYGVMVKPKPLPQVSEIVTDWSGLGSTKSLLMYRAMVTSAWCFPSLAALTRIFLAILTD